MCRREEEQEYYQGALEKADVVLDAGHGGKDGGAVNRDVLEKNINLEIAKLAKGIADGVRAFLEE